MSKYFKNSQARLTHGNALEEGPTITNMPEQERVKASIKMHKGVGKYFAPYSPEEVGLINQVLLNERKNLKN